jgi:hypothetical protein
MNTHSRQKENVPLGLTWLNNPWVLGVTGIAVFLLMSLLSHIDTQATGGGPNGILGLQFAFSVEAARTIIQLWGPQGAALIAHTMWIDYIYPPFYATFLASAIVYFSRKWAMFDVRTQMALIVPPYVAALLDYLENTLHLILLHHFPRLSAGLVETASIAATIKWLLVGWSLLVVLYLFVFQAVKWALARLGLIRQP